MPRTKQPEFARRATTHLSEEEVIALQRIAHEEGSTLAHMLRKATREFIANHDDAPAERIRAVAVS